MNNLKTNNYWLIPMDFSTCNYEQLQKEWDESKKIMWQVPGTPRKLKNGDWQSPPDSSMVNSLKKGDVIYFYVTNLPSESRNKLSRIMLRGVVKDEPCPMEKNKVYFDLNETNLIYAFSIECLTTLPKEQLENNFFLSRTDLKTNSSKFIIPHGVNWPDKNIKQNLSEDIIKRLERCFKPTTIRKYDFESLINHFNKKCFFCGKYGTKNDHKTFIGRNGLDYFEYHHFIPQAKAKDFPKLQEIIDNSTNGLFLCSNCHNKMHYGAVTEVRDILEIVLKDTQIQKMLTDFNFQKNIGEENDVFEWFQEAYKIKEHK